MIRITVSVAKDSFTYDYDGDRPLRVGRLPACDLTIANTDVSREHCTIEPDGRGGFTIRDLGAKNGVELNGARIAGEAALVPGDEVRLAPDATFRFGERAPAAAPAPAAEKPAPAGESADLPAADSGSSAALPPAAAAAPAPESPAERAKRAVAERAHRRRVERTGMFVGILVFVGALAYGAWAFVIPGLTSGRPDAAIADAGPNGGGGGTVRPSVELDLDPKRRSSEEEKEWERLERLDLEPDLMASALEAYARRYPGSRHARSAETRAASLRKVRVAGGGTGRPTAGGGGGAGGAAIQAALEREIDALLKAGSYAEAHYLATVAPRLGAGDDEATDRAAKRIEKTAYEKFSEARERSRALVREGRPFEAYDFLALQALPLKRFPFYNEVEIELRGLKRTVEVVLDSGGGARSTPGGGEGDRSTLERLVPDAKRAIVACDFETALERFRQILALPLTDQERLDYQWRLFDLERSRELFRMLLQHVAASAAGGPGARPPLSLSVTQAIKGDVIDADALGIKVALAIPGAKEKQLWERKWRDLAPIQVLEIMRGLEHGGESLIAFAAYCFEADYELEAHWALVQIWERFPAAKAEAASLLRRRAGVNASAAELVVFEGRVIATAEKTQILARRAEARAEAERIKAEIAAAKRDTSGRLFLSRANALIDAGMYVEGRLGLVEIWRRFKDVDVGKEARARYEDPFLRRRAQKVNGRDDNRVSIYSMAEGFPVDKNEEQEAFDRYADRTWKILEKTDYWGEYAGYHNSYAMNLWSQERGVDREPGGIKKDTPLGGEVNQGTFTINNGLVRQYLDRFPGPSVGVAIGNDNASVATGGGGACAIVKGMLDVTGHEIGHAFGGLGDEYDMDPSGRPNGPGGRSKTPLPSQVMGPNLIGGNQKDEMRRMAPWAHWIDFEKSQERVTQATGKAANWTGKIVDLFEGGNRTPFDVWRPQSDCRMRTSSSGFCCVCMEQMVLRLYASVRPIDEVEPKDEKVEIPKGDHIIFKAFTLRPKSKPLTAKWEIFDAAEEEAPDGSTVVRENKGKQLENVKMIDLPDGRGLYGAKVTAAPGLYDVVLTISDETPWVLVKERPGLSEKRTWRLRVRDKG